MFKCLIFNKICLSLNNFGALLIAVSSLRGAMAPFGLLLRSATVEHILKTLSNLGLTIKSKN